MNPIRQHSPAYCLIFALFFLLASSCLANAQAADKKFVSFADFFQSLSAANANDYVGHPDVAVKSAAAFEEMRKYLIDYYKNMTVKHSFDDQGMVFDCVPVKQQPGLKGAALTDMPPPPPDGEMSDTPDPGSAGDAQTTMFDTFGNKMDCEDGTIPLNRLTLNILTRFETLGQFMQKSPDGGDSLPQLAPSVE